MSSQTSSAIITASRKIDRVISRMRESDYDANTLHGQFIAAHEELRIALKRHDVDTVRLARRNSKTKIGNQILFRATDLVTP